MATLSEADIRGWVDGRSFDRGERYFEQGRVRSPQRSGDSVRARCAGSRQTAYDVQVTLGAEGIVSAQCSCPVGGGRCKHVAAVLLEWCDDPDQFRAVDDLDARLGKLSKADLIRLVKTAIEHQPNLEWILDLQAGGGSGGDIAADFGKYYQLALDAVPDDMAWGATWETAQRLHQVLAIAHEFEDAANARGAAAVHAGVLKATLEAYHFLHDEGEISDVILQCVDGIGEWLDVFEPGSDGRQKLLEALWDVIAFDTEMGGFGLSDPVPEILANHAQADERRGFAERLRQLSEEQTGDYANYTKARIDGLIIDIEKEDLDDEAFLAVCRKTGRTVDVVDRLFSLERNEEAKAAAAEAPSAYDLLTLAPVFAAHDHVEAFEKLMLARADQTEDRRVWQWLSERYADTGRTDAAVEMARRVFHSQPAVQNYATLKTFLADSDHWQAERGELIQWLRDKGCERTLIDVYLEDSEVRAALDTLDALQRAGKPFSTGDVLKVAAAAEEPFPDDAVRLYRDYAESLIGWKQRKHYHQACRYLTKVKALLSRLGRDAEWQQYAAQLRARYRRLPALLDEMSEASL